MYSAVLKVEKIGIINLPRIIESCYQTKSSSVKNFITEKDKFQKELDTLRDNITMFQTQVQSESDDIIIQNLTKKIETLRVEYTELYKKKGPELERLENIQASLFNEIYEVVRRIAEMAIQSFSNIIAMHFLLLNTIRHNR